MKRIAVFNLLILIFSVLVIDNDRVQAASEEDNLGYTISPVLPSSQIDPEKDYFYLKTKAGEEQTLEVRVKSTTKKKVTVKIYSTNAMTGDGGTIEYANDLADNDATLKSPITSMLKVETPELSVENYEEKRVEIKLTPPKESYTGIKMGALVFALDNGKEEETGVSTEFSYRIGMIASETGEQFNDGQSLNLNSVKAAIKRGKKMILANLQNPESKVLENVTINATMQKKGTTEIIKKKTVENYSLAPNSHFDFEMDWGINAMPSGTYVLKLEANNDNQEWHLNQEFTITNQQAKKMNEESAFKITTPNWIKISGIIQIVLVCLISFFILLRKTKWEKSWKKIRIKRKKKGKNKKVIRKKEGKTRKRKDGE